MKKFVLFIALIFVPIVIFAQEIEPPENWGDIFGDINKWLSELGAVAAATSFIAKYLMGWIGIVKRWMKITIPWVIAIAIVIGADLANVGYMAEMPIHIAALHGLAAGIIANGVASAIVKPILEFLEGLLKKKTG